MAKKTKIIATLGPASFSEDALEGLISAGANVVRLNMSHGDQASKAVVLKALRSVAKRLGATVAVLLDLQGPRIRVGKLPNGPLELKKGDKITLGPKGRSDISTTYPGLCNDLAPGNRVLLDDGLIELVVNSIEGGVAQCTVAFGGLLKESKGINLPDSKLSVPSVTDKDISDIAFGVAEGVDYIALSFVNSAQDVLGLKARLKELGSDTPVVAKVERRGAIESLDEIIEASDGVMIARGDLGVELSAEAVPILQKKIIARANAAGKLVITATQMLESMIKNPRPTRAEASDVANAVIDGTDALMLSGETAVGEHPVAAVETMARIATEAEEASIEAIVRLRRDARPSNHFFSQAVCYAAFAASNEVSAKAIVVFTQTGDTAQILSKLRPKAPIAAFTPLEKTARRLALVWGVRPYCIELGSHTDEMICRGEAALLDNGIAELGDTIVVVSGTKVGMRGATNMMKIDWIGSEECKLYLKGPRKDNNCA